MVDVEPHGPLRPRTRKGIDVREGNLEESDTKTDTVF